MVDLGQSRSHRGEVGVTRVCLSERSEGENLKARG